MEENEREVVEENEREVVEENQEDEVVEENEREVNQILLNNTTIKILSKNNLDKFSKESRKLSPNSDCNIINNSPISIPITYNIDTIYPTSETNSDRINRYNEIKTKMKKEYTEEYNILYNFVVTNHISFDNFMETICINYKNMGENIKNIEEDISSIGKYHKHLLETNGYTFTECLDTLFFQKKVLQKELDHLCILKVRYIDKYYGDFFKLNNKIVQFIKLCNKRSHFICKIDDQKNLPKYSDLEKAKLFDIEQIKNIYNLVDSNINNLLVYTKSYINTLSELHYKKNFGFHIKHYIVELTSIYKKTLTEIKSYMYLIKYLIKYHLNSSNNLKKKIKFIADQITLD